MLAPATTPSPGDDPVETLTNHDPPHPATGRGDPTTNL